MRWTVTVLVVFTCLLVASPVVAGKIGFVDAERAVATVREGQAKLRELEAWAEPERERIVELQNRLAEIQQRLAQQRSVASEEILAELQQEELQARRGLEDAGRRFERELERKQNEFLSDVAVKVGTVASDYGRANDYDAIFVLKAQPLVYVSESANLTEIVIRRYNERFPYQGN